MLSTMNLPYPRRLTSNNYVVNSGSRSCFRNALCAFFDVENVFMFENCFTAIALTLMHLTENRPKSVLTTAYSYRRTKDIIKWAQLDVHYLDSCYESFSMGPIQLEDYLIKNHQKIGVVLAQHAMVKILDYNSLERICDNFGIPLVFDSVEVTSPGQSLPHIGRNGNFEAFSLHPSKVINACEGGVITCDDATAAEQFDKFLGRIGYQKGYFNIPNSHAEFGLACLREYDEWVELFKNQNKTYKEFFEQVAEIDFISYDDESWSPNYKTSLIDIMHEPTRDQLISELARHNVPLRRMYHPFSVDEIQKYPVAENLSKRLCFLPMGETVQRIGQEFIIQKLHEILIQNA